MTRETSRAEDPARSAAGGPTRRVSFEARWTEELPAETAFAKDLLGRGIPGLSLADMRAYLEHVADRRLAQLGLPPAYGSANPFAFLELQDVQELSNFFERRVSAYQVAVGGGVTFDEAF